MAGNGKFINIEFPFKDGNLGQFLNLTNEDSSAIKSDLMHLLLTRKGERLYLPDFGTDLLKYIFEFNDGETRNDISRELNETVKKYIPNLIINSVDVTESKDSEHAVVVRIDYTVTEETFQETDFILLQI
jgi:phage baseplate assembly protein W